jgi:hypothetical protein
MVYREILRWLGLTIGADVETDEIRWGTSTQPRTLKFSPLSEEILVNFSLMLGHLAGLATVLYVFVSMIYEGSSQVRHMHYP